MGSLVAGCGPWAGMSACRQSPSRQGEITASHCNLYDFGNSFAEIQISTGKDAPENAGTFLTCKHSC